MALHNHRISHLLHCRVVVSLQVCILLILYIRILRRSECLLLGGSTGLHELVTRSIGIESLAGFTTKFTFFYHFNQERSRSILFIFKSIIKNIHDMEHCIISDRSDKRADWVILSSFIIPSIASGSATPLVELELSLIIGHRIRLDTKPDYHYNNGVLPIFSAARTASVTHSKYHFH